MPIKIDYHKAVDTIDEGILALNLLKSNIEFPESLKGNIIDILQFLSLARKPEFEELLFDNRISISKENLDLIHEKINDIQFSETNIDAAIKLFQKVTTQTIEREEINMLQKYLLEFSNPIWVTITSKKQYGE